MINTVLRLIKEAAVLMFGLFILSIVLQLFFQHTLIGKVLAALARNTFKFIRLSFKVMRKSLNKTYKCSKKAYKVLDKKYKKYNKKTEVKAAVNQNVIDIKKYMTDSSSKKQQAKSR